MLSSLRMMNFGHGAGEVDESGLGIEGYSSALLVDLVLATDNYWLVIPRERPDDRCVVPKGSRGPIGDCGHLLRPGERCQQVVCAGSSLAGGRETPDALRPSLP